jgi:hypothetical protein
MAIRRSEQAAQAGIERHFGSLCGPLRHSSNERLAQNGARA